MFSRKNILVVEAEFLIALEIQRILTEAHAAEMVFARSSDEAARFVDRLPQYDLVIVEIATRPDSSIDFSRAVQAAHVPLVITTVEESAVPASFGLAGVPVVGKPFTEAVLLAACAAALASDERKPPDDSGPAVR